MAGFAGVIVIVAARRTSVSEHTMVESARIWRGERHNFMTFSFSVSSARQGRVVHRSVVADHRGHVVFGGRLARGARTQRARRRLVAGPALDGRGQRVPVPRSA